MAIARLVQAGVSRLTIPKCTLPLYWFVNDCVYVYKKIIFLYVKYIQNYFWQFALNDFLIHLDVSTNHLDQTLVDRSNHHQLRFPHHYILLSNPVNITF